MKFRWKSGLATFTFSNVLFFLGPFPFYLLYGGLFCSALMLGCAQVLHMVANRTWNAGGWGPPVIGVLLSVFSIFPLASFLRQQGRQTGDQLLSKIALYQAKHGHPPQTLEDLVPEFLPDIPGTNQSLLGSNQFHYSAGPPVQFWFIAHPDSFATSNDNGVWLNR